MTKSHAGWALALATFTVAAAGCDEHRAHAHGSVHAAPPAVQAASGPAANAVQAEMRLLSEAMESTVRAIGSGDVRAVPHALHRVHEAKQATEAALEGGQYRLAKNGSVARFRELDEAFHTQLEALVRASAANDVPRTAEAFGAAMRGCQGCHTEFKP